SSVWRRRQGGARRLAWSPHSDIYTSGDVTEDFDAGSGGMHKPLPHHEQLRRALHRLFARAVYGMNPYANSLEHLHDELRRLDLLVRRAMLMARDSETLGDTDQLQGLVISESDIDSILRAKDFWGAWWQTQESKKTALAPLDRQLEALRRE